MSQNDAWEQRYAAIVPEKLTPRDATVLLDLIEEDTDRFVEALSALALTYEDEVVYCECAPDVNPGCLLGDHSEGHMVPADWRVSEAAATATSATTARAAKNPSPSRRTPLNTGSRSLATRRADPERRAPRTPDDGGVPGAPPLRGRLS